VGDRAGVIKLAAATLKSSVRLKFRQARVKGMDSTASELGRTRRIASFVLS